MPIGPQSHQPFIVPAGSFLAWSRRMGTVHIWNPDQTLLAKLEDLAGLPTVAAFGTAMGLTEESFRLLACLIGGLTGNTQVGRVVRESHYFLCELR